MPASSVRVAVPASVWQVYDGWSLSGVYASCAVTCVLVSEQQTVCIVCWYRLKSLQSLGFLSPLSSFLGLTAWISQP